MKDRLGFWAPLLFAGLCGACGDSDGRSVVIPADTSRFAGVYDVGVSEGDEIEHDTLGIVGGSGRDLHVSIFPPGVVTRVDFHGTLGDDGTVTVGQTFAQESDFLFEVVVGATALQVGDRLRITGNVRPADEVPPGLLSPFRFEMRRRVGARSDTFAGAWSLSFAESLGTCRCASTARLFLEIAPDGRGAMLFASELDATGRPVGFLHAGAVLVSPEGRVRVATAYGTPNPRECALPLVFEPLGECGATLTGTLAKHRGEGVMLVREPAFASLIAGAQWSATRVPTPPLPEPGDPAFGAAGNVLLADEANPDRDEEVDYLWVGFNDAGQWDAFLTLLGTREPGTQPWICGTTVPSPEHDLGFYLDPDTVAAAEVTAETFQIPIDILEDDPTPQTACPNGARITRVVSAAHAG